MSKAFTKDDAADEPALVAPRRPLPSGVTNYVTPRSLAALRAELHALDAERAALEGGKKEVQDDQGDEVTLQRPRGDERLEVVEIAYGEEERDSSR